MREIDSLLIKTIDWISEHDQLWEDYIEILDESDKKILINRGYELENDECE